MISVKRANVRENTVMATARQEGREPGPLQVGLPLSATITEGWPSSASLFSVDRAHFPCFPVKHADLRENTELLGDGGAEGVFP